MPALPQSAQGGDARARAPRQNTGLSGGTRVAHGWDMKIWGSLVVLLMAPACALRPTAYRAHYTTEAEVAEHRACAARCEEKGNMKEDLHQCLSRCPGFEATSGERCRPGREALGTYCVTVENSIEVDDDAVGAVAGAAIDAAFEHELDRALDDDDRSSEPAARSRSSRSSSATRAAEPRSHAPARPAARSAPSGRDRRR